MQPGCMCPITTIFSYMCYNTNSFVGVDVHAHTSVITHLPSANLHASHYRYTADLLRLEADSSRSPAICWPSYQTPINTGAMLPYLKAFPNRDFACYIRTGLTNGFHVGFTRRRDLLRSHCHNHPSLRANPAVVDEQIASGLVAGRLLGPISQDRFPFVHTSPLGLVPKSHQTNQWRLIHDLSSPKDYSVNDGIPRSCVRYAMPQLTRQYQSSRSLGGIQSSSSWILRMLIVLCLSTPPTTTCWALSGKATPTLTVLYHLVLGLLLRSLMLWPTLSLGF